MNQIILVIVPCYNEENRFNIEYFENVTKIQNTFWVFVDDGSSDQTANLLLEFCNLPNTHFLKMPKNLGKSEAIRIGMLEGLNLHSHANWVGFLDSDGAFSAYDIQNILGNLVNEVDKEITAIFSSRVKLAGRDIRRRIFRHILGRIIATFFGFIWKSLPYDTQSGFKVFRNSEFLQKSIQNNFSTRWFFDIEVSTRIASNKNGNLMIWEEPVSSWVDIAGSKISLREILRLLVEIPYIAFLLYVNRKCLHSANK